MEDEEHIIETEEEARRQLQSLQELVQQTETLVNSPELKREEDYLTKVVPSLEEATEKYQSISGYLQNHRDRKDKKAKSLREDYVRILKELQQVQRNGAKRREALCEAEFVAGNKVSTVEVQTAKEEVREAQRIADEAVQIKELFQEVGEIVYEQGQDMEQIDTKVDTIRVEIGRGVEVLAEARALQIQARTKFIYACLLLLGLLAAICVPLGFKYLS